MSLFEVKKFSIGEDASQLGEFGCRFCALCGEKSTHVPPLMK
jgi:hypothetical protein